MSPFSILSVCGFFFFVVFVKSTAWANTKPTTGLLLAQADVAPLVSGQRVRVKKMARDMASVRASVVTTGPSRLQDPQELEKLKKRFGQFTEAVKRYPQHQDPDVITARKEYQALQQTLSAEFKRASEQMKQLGNVQQRLATLKKNTIDYPVPAPMTAPFTQEQAANWVKAASSARTVGEHNASQLSAIAELAYLPETRGTPESGAPYDQSDVQRMQRFALESQQAVQANYAAMQSQLQSQLQQIESDVLTRWQDNPDSDKRWTFVADGQEEEAMELYDQSIAIANSVVYLEQALGRKADNAQNLIKSIDQARVDFAEKKRIAIATARMPQPASTDPQMLDIALKILATPSYELGDRGPVVLTTDSIVDRERKDSEIDIDDAEITLSGDLKFSGTETTWTYKWQEFKFAVPIKDKASNDWHIWWITAKNFSSGGDNTPLNRWLSGKMTKGVPILPENFPEDQS